MCLAPGVCFPNHEAQHGDGWCDTGPLHPKLEHAPRGLLVRRHLVLQLVALSMTKGVSPRLCVMMNLSQAG